MSPHDMILHPSAENGVKIQQRAQKERGASAISWRHGWRNGYDAPVEKSRTEDRIAQALTQETDDW